MYYSRPTDTEEVTALGERASSIESAQRVLSSTLREVEEKIDAARLAQRPEFPTDRQVEAIRFAALAIRDKVKARSHHGDPAIAGDYIVKVDGDRGWLSIQDLAPPSARSSGKLWSFTDEEVEAFKDVLLSEGLQAVDSWYHMDGVSIVVH